MRTIFEMTGFAVELTGKDGRLQALMFEGRPVALDTTEYAWGFSGAGPGALARLLVDLVSEREAPPSAYAAVIDLIVASWPMEVEVFSARLPSAGEVSQRI
jgi:hypothetical protein